jgi:plastocyanin
MLKRILLVLGGLLVCVAIAIAALGMKHKAPTPAPKENKVPVQHIASVQPQPVPASPPQVTLIFDQYGFEPNEFKVPVGTVIMVKNTTNKVLNFQSLPYNPTPLPGLNIGVIAPGTWAQFSVSKLGSWQFQANNNPALRGDVTGISVSGSWSGLTNNELPRYDAKTKSLLLNYTDYGFLPNIVTVPVGTKVTVLNSTDEGGMYFSEMPGYTSPDPGMQLGIIGMNQSASFTLTRAGTWHYVNTWEPTDMGEITAR